MRFALITLGCPKNEVDSEHILGRLRDAGFEPVPHPEDADTVIVNTCGFIGPAVEESTEEIERILALKREGKIHTVAVGGCLVGRLGAVLRKRFPEVDVFFTMPDLEALPDLLRKKHHGRFSRNRFIHRHTFSRTLTTGAFAYLKIAEGCDRTCSFCIIPIIRGRQVSYPVNRLLEEARALVQLGVKELNLVAQDTVRFGMDREEPDALWHLLEGLEALPGLAWVRLFYLHPSGITPEFVRRLREFSRVVPYAELPIQHASPRILRAMRRTGGREAVEQAVEAFRMHWPEAVLRTEVIVGFPGEKEEDFQELLDFLEEVRFERIGIFPYHDEPESLSASLPNKVPPEEVEARLEEVQTLAHRLMMEAQQRFVGTTLPVLVDRPGEGRTPHDAPDVDFVVNVPAEIPVGSLVSFQITGVEDSGDLMGTPVSALQPEEAK